MPGNVWNRPSGSFMVDMISLNIMEAPSVKCYMTFWDMTIYSDTLNWSDINQFANLLPILTFLPNFGGFHRTLQRVRLVNRGRLLLRTPSPVPFWTCICSDVETIFHLSLSCFRTLNFEHPSVLLFCFLALIAPSPCPRLSWCPLNAMFWRSSPPKYLVLGKILLLSFKAWFIAMLTAGCTLLHLCCNSWLFN